MTDGAVIGDFPKAISAASHRFPLAIKSGPIQATPSLPLSKVPNCLMNPGQNQMLATAIPPQLLPRTTEASSTTTQKTPVTQDPPPSQLIATTR